jgi:hypothetical protein
MGKGNFQGIGDLSNIPGGIIGSAVDTRAINHFQNRISGVPNGHPKIARRFNSRLKANLSKSRRHRRILVARKISGAPSELGPPAYTPIAKTPGYYQLFLRNSSAGDATYFGIRKFLYRAFKNMPPLLGFGFYLRPQPQRVKANERVGIKSHAPFAADPLRLGSVTAAALNPEPLCL